MTHVGLHEYHLNPIGRKDAGTIVHDGLRPVAEEQRIEPLAWLTQFVACQFVVACMAEHLYKAAFAFGQEIVLVEPFDLETELTSPIDGKAVDDDLRKAIVIEDDVAKSLQRPEGKPTTEETILRQVALAIADEVERDDEDGRDDVEDTHGHHTQHRNECPVHPGQAIGGALPFRCVLGLSLHRQELIFFYHELARQTMME